MYISRWDRTPVQQQLQGVLAFSAAGLFPTSARSMGEGVLEIKLAPSGDPWSPTHGLSNPFPEMEHVPY